MSFSINTANSKAPWVEVDRPSNDRSPTTVDETERLFASDEPVIEAFACEDFPVIPHEMEREEREEYPQAVVAASATAGGILGCLLGGIGCAIVGGLGSAYAAKHKGGTCVGDFARAMGEVALTAREKAIALDGKHHIVTSTKTATSKALENAKAMDEEYHVAEKSKNCLVHTGKAAIDFASRHRLVERSVKGVGRGMSYLGGKIVDPNGSPITTGNNSSDNYDPVATQAGM